MKQSKIKFVITAFLILFAITLSGCEFSFFKHNQPQTISGFVTFEGNALSEVKIRSDFYVYATTNQDGFYSFTTTTKKFDFYAKKNGYNFLPKSFNTENKLESYDFDAQEAMPLNGTLNLSAILVSPSSIVSLHGNNYSYQNENLVALKVAEFQMFINKTQKETLDYKNENEKLLLNKNEFTNILNQDDLLQFEIEDGQINLQIEFLIKAYYKYTNFDETVDDERHATILKISATLDTGDLNENNQVKFTASGINSTNYGFTYNIQFIFDFKTQ